MIRFLRKLFGFTDDAGYTSPPGYHRHRCSLCGFVWEHADNCAGDWPSHICPNCRHDDGDIAMGWPQYSGPLPPQVKQP